MAEKSHMPYLAIVVLVAVVAVVMLVLNVRQPSEEAVAGEAFKQKSARAAVPTAEVAPVEEGGKCNPVFIQGAEIARRFGTGNILVSYSAGDVCQQLGYSNCLAGQMVEITRLYGSTDGTCNENINLADKPLTQITQSDNYMVTCAARGTDDIRGIPSAGVCQDYVGDWLDSKLSRSLNGVLCCS